MKDEQEITSPTSKPSKGSAGSGGGNFTGLESNVASVLCYICMPITSIIFLILEKQNPEIRFHAWQGTLLGAGAFLLLIILKIVAAVAGWIAGILGAIVGFFIPILMLAVTVTWVVCLVKAYQGERWSIPVIGDISAQKVAAE